jgi:regulator of RNase E activity RraB
MAQERIDPNTATYRELVQWLLWDASDATLHYWAESWLRQNDIDELRKWVQDALPEPDSE